LRREIVGAVAELPHGTVTTVFTDIEGSTGLLRKLGKEAYLEELELHRTLLRDVFGRHGGREVELQGDCFHFAFSSASEAVVAAAEAQRALADASWPHGEPIRVRVGIHTGEPSAAKDLYVGIDIHRAARVMSAGHGGQVLLSETTALLTREELPPELALRDLGNHQLKDLVAAERLYQLGNEEFPPLRTGENGAGHALEGNHRRPGLIQALRGRRTLVAVLAGLLIAGLATVGAVVRLASSSAPVPSGPISIGAQSALGNVSGLALAESGSRVQFHGTVPSGRAGVPVVLQASIFPFRRFSDVSRATSSRGGSYSLDAEIPVATRYRVALFPSGGSVSRTITVYVTTAAVRQVRVDKRRRGTKLVHVAFSVQYPASIAAQEAAKPIYFYAGVRDKRGGWPKHYRLELKGKLEQHIGRCAISRNCFSSPNTLAPRYAEVPYVFSFREPTSDSGPAYDVAVCSEDTEAVDGFGLPGHHRCGDRFIPDRNDPRAFPNVGYLG
jgi:class 3 adenylate cyclase